MIAHVFRGLALDSVQRGHPVISALLCSYCPAAVRWWRAGADPSQPFDPFWAVLEHRSAGRTLMEALEFMDLAGLAGFARRYVSKVEDYRGQARNRRIASPEQLPTFLEEKLPLAYRHEFARALEKIGGWQNFSPFLRAWAFVFPDWLQQLRIEPHADVRIVDRSIDFLKHPLFQLPFWQFRGSGRKILGAFTQNVHAPTCFLTAFLVQFFEQGIDFDGDEMYILDSLGRAHRYRAHWSTAELAGVLEGLSVFASSGPYPPLMALNDLTACTECGYEAICWKKSGGSPPSLTPLALNF